ncbi:MAG: hypothetical protein H6R10_1470 [Rhodocyclaceae bacterium]|nr:hypothetical protein [Rhodocyclaceae bacterium]
MTRLANPAVLACPYRGHPVLQRRLASWRDFGTVFWSDGYASTLRLGTVDKLGRCPECAKLFWLDEAKELGVLPAGPRSLNWPWWRQLMYRLAGDPGGELSKLNAWNALPPTWQRAMAIESPEANDLRQALAEGLGTTPERESYLRTRLWWAGNDKDRGHQGKVTMLPEEKQANKVALLALIQAQPSEKRNQITESELLRELGRFEEAIALLKDAVAGDVFPAQIIVEKALAGDVRVCEVSRTNPLGEFSVVTSAGTRPPGMI